MFTLSFAGFACDRPSHAATDLPAPEADLDRTDAADRRHAVLAAGCFWCVEAVFEQLDGVTSVVSGYAGGTKDTADYRAVSSGQTRHAEVIQVTYEPSRITYGQLLKVFFTIAHDPTQLNRQGPDSGTQYRSAIFYQSEDEKRVAQSYIDQLTAAKLFAKPIVTTLEPLDAFYPAEDDHQDYVKHNPANPYVVHHALPKVEKLRQKYPDGKVAE